MLVAYKTPGAAVLNTAVFKLFPFITEQAHFFIRTRSTKARCLTLVSPTIIFLEIFYTFAKLVWVIFLIFLGPTERSNLLHILAAFLHRENISFLTGVIYWASLAFQTR